MKKLLVIFLVVVFMVTLLMAAMPVSAGSGGAGAPGSDHGPTGGGQPKWADPDFPGEGGRPSGQPPHGPK